MLQNLKILRAYFKKYNVHAIKQTKTQFAKPVAKVVLNILNPKY